MSEVKQYAERDLMAMDIAGNHYCRHVDHMTREKLHSKSDIAAELGWRDMQIAAIKAERDALAAENAAFKSAFMPKEIPTEATDNFSDTAVLRIDGDEFHSWQWVDNQDEVIRGVLSFFKPKSPATDAYLNSVRANAVQALWDDSLNDVGQVLAEIRAYDDASEAAGIVHSEIKERVEDFAAQLRAGKDGE